LKKFFYYLTLSFWLSVGGLMPVARAQAPPQTADTYVRPYTEAFQYGTNLGYYNDRWNDELLAGLAQQRGSHTLRPALPEYFVDQYGYDIRVNTFRAYTTTLGMKELTCFVEGPSAAHREATTYPGAAGQSKVFANLYEPIWQADGSVNANNYYAAYLYRLLLTYGDYVRFWEIVNEPDFTNMRDPKEWAGRPPAPGELVNLQAPVYSYIRMLRISYEVIHKYRPEAYVTTGGVGYPAFVDALLRYTDNPDGGRVTAQYPRGGGAYLDALSFHSYPSYELHDWDGALGGFRYRRTSDGAARQVLTDQAAMQAVLNRYGYDGSQHPRKPLIITETNVSRRTSEDRTGSDELQRNFGIKTLVLSQQSGVGQLYFYSLGEGVNAPPAGQSVSGDGEIALMGLYENLNRDAPGQARPTQLGQGFASTSRLLYGYAYDPARTAALALPPAVDGAAFRQGSAYRYVLWAKALVDNSEQASATYSFPAAWNLGQLKRAEWDFASTSQQTSTAPQAIALSGSPAFFSETGAAAPPPPPPAPPTTPTTGGGAANTGGLLRERWNGVSGSTVASIPLAQTPDSSGLVRQFETPDRLGNNYAARLRGYVCPPQSGSYTFWLAADDEGELFLSPDEDPTHAVRVARCAVWTASAHDWSRSPEQQSAPVTLQAGRRYYVEARHKQAWGGGYLAVAWRRPDGSMQEPIPGTALAPFGTTAATPTPTPAPAPPVVVSPPSGPSGSPTSARIVVTFATAPARAHARLTPLLYDKRRVLQFEEDDSPVAAFDEVYPLLHGGVARDGQTYPGLRFGDGCGHNRAYTAAVAVNGHNPYNQSEWLSPGPNHDPSRLTWTQAQTLLDHGWDLENHSDLHTAAEPARQMATLDALLASHLRGYQPTVCVVPTNYAGYPTAAFAAGYLAVSSASQSDGLPMLNRYNADRVALSTLPAPGTPFVYQRYNADRDLNANETAATQLRRLQTLSDALLAPGSAPDESYLQRVFTHGVDFGVLRDWLTYTQRQAQQPGTNSGQQPDQLWVTTLREFDEYRRVSRQVGQTETLRGNVLTVDLDYAALSPNTRFQSLSWRLDAPGAAITSIVVTGADSSSSNAGTGLINVFRSAPTTGTNKLTTSANALTSNASALRTDASPNAPLGSSLSVYPNPSHGGEPATVQFTVAHGGPVLLALFSPDGRLLSRLFSGAATAGEPHREPLPPNLPEGLYLLRLTTATEVLTRKVVR